MIHIAINSLPQGQGVSGFVHMPSVGSATQAIQAARVIAHVNSAHEGDRFAHVSVRGDVKPTRDAIKVGIPFAHLESSLRSSPGRCSRTLIVLSLTSSHTLYIAREQELS